MKATEVEYLKQVNAWRGIQGKDGYNPPWSSKTNNFKLGIKNKQVKFSDEVEKTQSAK